MHISYNQLFDQEKPERIRTCLLFECSPDFIGAESRTTVILSQSLPEVLLDSGRNFDPHSKNNNTTIKCY